MIQQADDLVRTAPLEVLDEDVPKPEQTTPGSTRTDPPWSRFPKKSHDAEKKPQADATSYRKSFLTREWHSPLSH